VAHIGVERGASGVVTRVLAAFGDDDPAVLAPMCLALLRYADNLFELLGAHEGALVEIHFTAHLGAAELDVVREHVASYLTFHRKRAKWTPRVVLDDRTGRTEGRQVIAA
jgi:hypothetical protein